MRAIKAWGRGGGGNRNRCFENTRKPGKDSGSDNRGRVELERESGKYSM